MKATTLSIPLLVMGGGVLGYLAAINSTQLTADAAPGDDSHQAAAANPASSPVGQSAEVPSSREPVPVVQAPTTTALATAALAANGKKPNIVVIMGDDIGMWNIGAYHRGLMAGRTPNIDKLASQGAIFTDYYAEASCTAGRASFITGELPIRTGLTTVGQAARPSACPPPRPRLPRC
ncbi:MAG: sulfatase-like hydrolase/transferase [Planctomycetales bacterium]